MLTKSQEVGTAVLHGIDALESGVHEQMQVQTQPVMPPRPAHAGRLGRRPAPSARRLLGGICASKQQLQRT
jgi:hypothetical protein